MGLGPELVVNGGFDEDDHWLKGAGWTISEGKANYAVGTYGTRRLSQTLPVENILSFPATVEVRFTISNLVSPELGSISLDVQGLLFPAVGGITENKEYVGTISGISNATVIMRIASELPGGSDRAFSVDNVSVREVIADGGGGIFMDIFDELWAD